METGRKVQKDTMKFKNTQTVNTIKLLEGLLCVIWTYLFVFELFCMKNATPDGNFLYW